MKKLKLGSRLGAIVVFILTLLSFQNCSEIRFSKFKTSEVLLSSLTAETSNVIGGTGQIPVGQTPQSQKICTHSSSTLTSQDGSHSCEFSWSQSQSGESLKIISATGGGMITGICRDSGWDVVSSCPNLAGTSAGETAPVACSGGGAAIESPDGSNSCQFSWSRTSVGGILSRTTSSGGHLSAECMSDGQWNYTGACPNLVGVTCPGGGASVSSADGSNTCRYSWGMANPGSPLALNSATGGGTASGQCLNSGWDVEYLCPNQTPQKSCGGGSVNIPSASGRANGCRISWPQAGAGQSVSGTGTNGGSVSGTCNVGGSWDNVESSCP